MSGEGEDAPAVEVAKVIGQARVALDAIELDEVGRLRGDMDTVSARLRVIAGVLAHAAELLTAKPRAIREAEQLPDWWRKIRRERQCAIIETVVAEHFGFTRKELRGRSVQWHLKRARLVAIYLSFRLVRASRVMLGSIHGVDVPVVLHAIRKIGDQRDTDTAFADELTLLINKIFERASRDAAAGAAS